MSGRNSYIGAKSWLALLAIGYLAVGAPLIHPFLHDHHGGPDGHGHQIGSVILSAELYAIGHDCLICHFLGKSQAVASKPPSNMVAVVPAGRLGGDQVSFGKSPSTFSISRAPPLSLFFCIA